MYKTCLASTKESFQLKIMVGICFGFSYNPKDYYDSNQEIRQIMDQINNGYFNPDEPHLFKDIYNSLVHHDR